MKILIEQANDADLDFVRELAVRSVHHGIPPTRRADRHEVEEKTRTLLENLPRMIRRDYFRLFIARDTDRGCSAGYLMLVLDQVEGSTGEKQALIHDLAVSEEYRGKYVVDRLMEKAEEEARKEGLSYVVGEISAGNRRPLVYATRRLGYQVERYQIVKVLDNQKNNHKQLNEEELL